MDETNDIFIHTEGKERAAYQAGSEIARMSVMGQERFTVALFQWMRQHGARPIWIVDEKGDILRAEELERDIQAHQ